ncbi:MULTISPECIES: S9 family peptidase [unclassified Colwellia]|uniref:S9 family peptidase n=1 Tax=unclassified Colwellia TaxID=196834 RepID=UPI0015F5A30A|nr:MULTISPECIES: S9 family peptidase [unclassified Colwellia]MBA6232159.1 S9 family peptidase [Colwellia sp. MB02u-7]MBA6237143.1 S9 family peptidase [Colwellia sp. MB02u-11]MBA6257425.1 S9 family peptidase [Colwellia sp. MB3u-28]MBA6260497.1 S9 family peptidase [Colwellia sp. MB3u-41]MBA6301593.1 S9 family peptidase [Colwellia sp. MB3u-22]
MPKIKITRWLNTTVLTTAVAISLMACQSTSTESTTETKMHVDKSSPLTVERIYKDREFSSDYISRLRWLADGSGYTIVEKSAKTTINEEGKEVSIGHDIVVYNPDTLERTVLISAQQLTPKGTDKPLTIDNYIWSDDRQKLLIYTNSKKVWRSNSRGDYWLLDIKAKKLMQLGGKKPVESSLMFAKFSPDASKVAYVVADNIYVENLTNNKVSQLTFDAGNGKINGLFDWVYEEEFTIKDGFRWSPDGEKIAYWQLDTSGSKDFIMINNTDELYPTITKFPYPKVGETNALPKVGVVHLATAKTTWANLPNNSRNMYIPRMNWSGNSQQILVQHVNRKQDTNILYLANANTGDVTSVMTEQEKSFLDFFDDARWLNQGNSFLWTSERSGWRHVFNITRDGKTALNLTEGNFDVISIQTIDEENGWLYYIASPDNVAQRYLYRSKLDGSLSNQRVTPEEFSGTNSYQMSADGQWAIHSHSTFTQPTQKRLVKVEGHQVKHMMMDNKVLIERLASLPQTDHEFFQVKAQDGIVLDGYIIRPADFDPKKKYPIIFYVYGESWGQTVTDSWRGNAAMWDQMLTEQGFIIASIDNRGTRTPKGREWRKSIYGAVGVLSSRDQSDALKAMAKRWDYIDTDNVAIWGHSGGGSMTLNMIFRYPDQYHVGVSLAPVPDQRLYDSIYQERYSGLLEDYAEGYKQGSPITHAKNLKGKLLLIHGTGDDNVHYQGSERLINELVKHNRQFDFMSYPNRSHGLYEGSGTTLHIKTMMTNYFNTHLKL